MAHFQNLTISNTNPACKKKYQKIKWVLQIRKWIILSSKKQKAFILTEHNFPSSDCIYQNGRPAKNQVFFSQPKTLNSGSPWLKEVDFHQCMSGYCSIRQHNQSIRYIYPVHMTWIGNKKLSLSAKIVRKFRKRWHPTNICPTSL